MMGRPGQGRARRSAQRTGARAPVTCGRAGYRTQTAHASLVPLAVPSGLTVGITRARSEAERVGFIPRLASPAPKYYAHDEQPEDVADCGDRDQYEGPHGRHSHECLDESGNATGGTG